MNRFNFNNMFNAFSSFKLIYLTNVFNEFSFIKSEFDKAFNESFFIKSEFNEAINSSSFLKAIRRYIYNNSNIENIIYFSIIINDDVTLSYRNALIVLLNRTKTTSYDLLHIFNLTRVEFRDLF